jgi:hypothetical protein
VSFSAALEAIKKSGAGPGGSSSLTRSSRKGNFSPLRVVPFPMISLKAMAAGSYGVGLMGGRTTTTSRLFTDLCWAKKIHWN